MKNKAQTIEIAYEASCGAFGEEACRWLIEAGIASESEPAESNAPGEGGFVCRRFIAARQIAADSSIVFVSDTAVTNGAWQAYVRAVPPQMRLIPVGGVENVDYSDENVLPKRIEEINFIRTDNYLHPNLLDSLITDPAFYALKNRLLLGYYRWEASDSKADLLSNLREIRRSAAVIRDRLPNETDDYLKAQLQHIDEYLSASYSYTKKALRTRTVQRIRIGAVVLVAAALTTLFFVSRSIYKRASLANLVVSVDSRTVQPERFAVQTVEALFNPFSSPESIAAAHDNLLRLMDMVWTQTPIGTNYKHSINDLALPSGSRYVWTGDVGGRVVRWDTYTGETTQTENVSAESIVLVAVGEDDETLAAADMAGAVYLRRDGTWNRMKDASGIASVSAEMKLHGDTVLIYDDARLEIFSGGAYIKPALGVNGAQILSAGFDAAGRLTVAGSENGAFFTALFTAPDGAPEIRRYPEIGIGALSAADIKNSVIAVKDADGQVWKIENGEAERSALLLPVSNEIHLTDESTVIYIERNRGVGLFDLDASFDYGDVLSSVTGAETLFTNGEFVVIVSGRMILPVSLAGVLPVKDPAAAEKKAVYDRQKCEPDASCLLKSAEVVENSVVILNVTLPDTGEAVQAQIDPMLLDANMAGYTANRKLSELTQDAFVFTNEPFFAGGASYVVGARYAPVDRLNDTPGCFVMIGCADGSFAELWLNAENATLTTVRLHRIPSGCAVKAIYETDGGYLLLDEGGRYWPCSSGAGTVSEKGIVEAVKAKLHAGMYADMQEKVSKQVWNALDLKICPGGDGKEWE